MSLESKPFLQILFILFAAALLALPCLIFGMPQSANALPHIRYQHHFDNQFWGGELYPRWLADENKGFGCPIFVAQYPLPYYVTTLFRPIFSSSLQSRESRELGLFCFIALAAAGIAAWTWMRKFSHPLAALFAAITYISLPFVLQDGIYARGAIGELATFIWMPLALLASEYLSQTRKALFVLSMVFALLILSNLLTTVLFAPFLTLYAIMRSKDSEHSILIPAVRVFLAEALGAGIAAIYLIPSLAHRHLFDLKQMESIASGYQFALYFLQIGSNLQSRSIPFAIFCSFVAAVVTAWYIWRVSATSVVKKSLALLLILGALPLIPNVGPIFIRLSGFHLRPTPPNDTSALMFLGMFLTVVLAVLAYCRISEDTKNSRAPLLLFIVFSSFFLMLPFSAPLWKLFPGSTAVQFPFRLGGTLCIAVAGLLAIALDSSSNDQGNKRLGPSRLLVSVAAVITFAFGFLIWRMDRFYYHPRITQFEATQDVDTMIRSYVPIPKVYGFASIIGASTDSYDIESTAVDPSQYVRLVSGDCKLSVTRENPRTIAISSDCRGESLLQIGLLYSPLWKVTPDASSSNFKPVVTSSDAALTQLTLGSGRQLSRLNFSLGPTERLGQLISIISLLIALIGFLFSRRRSSAPQ
jgi:hypothetical protein